MTTKKTTQKSKAKATKVDFEPNKMTVAIASLGAVTLALLSVIIVYS